MTSIRQALETNRKYVSIGTLNDSVALLKNIDRSTDALSMLKFFEEEQDDIFWESENDSFRRGAYDPDVEEALKNNRPREQAEFNLERELLAASKNLNSDVIKNIANEITPAKMRSAIKDLKEDRMRSLIYAGLEFGKFGNASEEMLKIVEATKAALKMIGRENRINAARVEKYGVKVDRGRS